MTGTALRALPAAAALVDRSADTRFALLNDAFAVDAVRYAVQGECTLEIVFVSSAAAAVAPAIPGCSSNSHRRRA